MNVEKINQLKETVESKVQEAFKNSDLGEFLISQGLAEDSLQLKLTINLKKLQTQDTIKDIELRDSLREMPGEEITLLCCCGCPLGLCCNCC